MSRTTFRTLLAVSALLVPCTVAAAQGGWVRPPPKAPPDPNKLGRRADLLEDRLGNDEFGSKQVQLTSGSRVVGRTGMDAVHHLRFQAVRGAKVWLRLAAKNTRLGMTALLLGPDGIARPLTGVPGKPGLYELRGFDVPATGTWQLDLSFDKSATGDYELDTRVELPKHEEAVLDLAGGRPHRIVLPGLEGRSVELLEIRSGDLRDSVALMARLTDPDGLKIDLAPYLTVSPARDALYLRDLPLPIAGDYELVVADRNRGKGEAKVAIRYRNPPPGTDTLRL